MLLFSTQTERRRANVTHSPGRFGGSMPFRASYYVRRGDEWITAVQPEYFSRFELARQACVAYVGSGDPPTYPDAA